MCECSLHFGPERGVELGELADGKGCAIVAGYDEEVVKSDGAVAVEVSLAPAAGFIEVSRHDEQIVEPDGPVVVCVAGEIFDHAIKGNPYRVGGSV